MRPIPHFSTSPLAGQGTRKTAPAGQSGAVARGAPRGVTASSVAPAADGPRTAKPSGRSTRRDSFLRGALGKEEPQAEMARMAHGDGACNRRGEALAGTEDGPA